MGHRASQCPGTGQASQVGKIREEMGKKNVGYFKNSSCNWKENEISHEHPYILLLYLF